MSPEATIWPLDPHTKGKHEVLRHYLSAWFPILASTEGRILFIDGFAGPGEYAGGEEGSPIIALKAFLQYGTRIQAEVRFGFIEKYKGRARHLDSLIEKLRPSLPENGHVDVLTGTFGETMSSVLDELDAQEKTLAPAFVMIDPFGVSDTPMSVIRRVLQGDKTEVYISFMYEALNRFLMTAQFEPHLDALFGIHDWNQALSIVDPEERKTFLYGLYEAQLRKAGAKHVIHFEVYEEVRLVYAIFFATKHWRGADKMKHAIWKVEPSGRFAFHGTRSQQLRLGLKPDYTPLRKALQRHFRGKGWVTIERVLQFVGSDQTYFHTSQVKRPVLAPMEKEKLIEVDAKSRASRKGTYPDHTRLRFL